MNLHQTQTEFNGGIDLHTRNMYLCVMNRAGDILVHKKIRNNSMEYLGKLIEPFSGNITLCCESTVNWYILHDFCTMYNIPFALGHALYIGAIAQSKKKNDKLDSQRLADLLRSNLLPIGYACPKEYRDIRDPLRRRLFLVEKRTSLKVSMTMATHMYGYEVLTSAEKKSHNRREAFEKRVDNPMTDAWCTAYINVIEEMDSQIETLAQAVLLRTRELHPEDLKLLLSFPGVGKVLGLTILLESAGADRFPSVKDYASYSRLIVPDGESDGKSCGKRGRKIGNRYLKWAFSEVVFHAVRTDRSIARYFQYLETKHGKNKAKAILAHRFGRAIFNSLKNQVPFSMKKFLVGKESMIEED